MTSLRERGFTVVEMMVSLGLSAAVCAAVFTLVRGQLIAHEMSDQILRSQANVRAGTDYVENVLRRACGGVSQGGIGINVGGGVAATVTSCVRVYDAAPMSGTEYTNGTFTSGAAANAVSMSDAIEFIYPTTTPTMVVSLTGLSLKVGNIAGLAQGDFLLVSDGTNGVVVKAASVTADAGSTTPSYPGGTVVLATAVTTLPSGYTGVTAGNTVFKVSAAALYVPTTGTYANMLLYDPDGPLGTTHDDADPLVDGVVDLQVAVAVDANGDGLITENASSAGADEWVGNYAGELPLPATPWNTTGASMLRSMRVTLLTRTINTYSGGVPALGPYEDRSTFPTVSLGTPRYRSERIVVSPRAWNLSN